MENTKEKQLLIDEITMITKEQFKNVFLEIYQKTKSQNKNIDYILRDFQLYLKNATQWKRSQIRDETSKKLKITGLEDLLNRLYNLNRQIYSNDELDYSFEEKLSVTENFFKDVVLNTCRLLWKSPFIVYELVENKQIYKYQMMFDKIVIDGIFLAIRRKAYNNDDSSSSDESEFKIQPEDVISIPFEEDFLEIEPVDENDNDVQSVRSSSSANNSGPLNLVNKGASDVSDVSQSTNEVQCEENSAKINDAVSDTTSFHPKKNAKIKRNIELLFKNRKLYKDYYNPRKPIVL